MTKLLKAVYISLAAFMALMASGCARTYPQKLLPVRRLAAAGSPVKAIEALEKTGMTEEDRNRLLYHLEAGLLYHLAGEYRESNRFLESAEWISDEMYTRSLTLEAAALLTSENLLPYRGENYDYLFINYYKLLNYLHLGLTESALVEVRRINYKLSLFEKEDAFLHWLTAILHRQTGQDSSAFIEYMKAYRAFEKHYPGKFGIQMPKGLIRDIGAFIAQTRFHRASEFPETVRTSYTPPPGHGSVVFIVETGFSPHKEEVKIEAAIPQKVRDENKEKLGDIYHLTVSMPEYVPVKDKITGVTLNINGSPSELELVEDIGAMALNYFDSAKAGMLAKAVTRAVAKYAAYKAVRGKDEDNKLRRMLSTSVNIIGSATERADTRSWLMLPDRIFMSREYLEPGSYSFEAALTSGRTTEKTERGEFTVEKGELKFIILRRY